MAEILRERAPVRPVESRLPSIRREERELHSPIDALGRSAVHLRTPHEAVRQGGATAIARASLDMRVARNVSDLRLEGSTPMGERFLRLLQSL